MDNTSGILIRSFRIPIPGVQKKVIYHFSDIHLTLWDSLSDPEEIRKANEGVEGWNGTRSWFAEHYGEPNTPPQQKSAPEHFSDLLNLSGQQGQKERQGKKHRGKNHSVQLIILSHYGFSPFHFDF